MKTTLVRVAFVIDAHLLFQAEEKDEDDLNGAAEPRLTHVHLAHAHVCTGHIIFILNLLSESDTAVCTEPFLYFFVNSFCLIFILITPHLLQGAVIFYKS